MLYLQKSGYVGRVANTSSAIVGVPRDVDIEAGAAPGPDLIVVAVVISGKERAFVVAVERDIQHRVVIFEDVLSA